MNYVQLYQAIQDYTETTEPLFVSNIPRFVQEAEDRIYNSVQLPSLRKNVTGTLTSGNQYLSLPNDWLSAFSLAVVDSSGNYNYLLNKDVNYIRQAYPNATTSTGLPQHYALFGSQYSNINELSVILGPTPDSGYTVELHYYYYPPTIVQGEISALGAITGGTGYTPGTYSDIALSYTSGSTLYGSGATVNLTVSSAGVITSVTLQNGGQFYTAGDNLTVVNTLIGNSGSGFSIPVAGVTNSTGTSWLGDNYDPVLFYGALREAMLFQKQETDMIQNIEQKYQEAMQQLNRLGTGLERGDAYRNGQAKIKVNP
jgi:hypothetical protein